jgi:hypothetical protein
MENSLETAYHIILKAIISKVNKIKDKTPHPDIEIVINNSIFENMKKFINDTEGKVINYNTVDDNPNKIYFIGTLAGMKCFIDTSETHNTYQAYARYKKLGESRYYVEDINFLDEIDESIKKFFV